MRKIILGRGRNEYQSPEVGVFLLFRNSQEVIVAGAECATGERSN